MRRRFWETNRGEWEVRELAQRFPSLRIDKQAGDGTAIVSGAFHVTPEIAYTIRLSLSAIYPREAPILHCHPREIPWELDRHVLPNSGTACLCARSEYRLHWPEGSTVSDFIERLVRPFLSGQFYYDAHDRWPPTGQRSHGVKGIIEAYTELCEPLGGTSLETIEKVMRLLARTNDPKGHEPCPCGSGLRLRHCHRDAMSELRRMVWPRDAAADLHHLLAWK